MGIINDLIKKFQRFVKGKDQNVYIHVNLWCPDGKREALGFSIPEEIDRFISFVNNFSKKKEYTIELLKIDINDVAFLLTCQSKNFTHICRKLGI